MTFPDPGHVNGFYLRQFFGMTEWASGGHDHPLEYVDPRTPEGLDAVAALLIPHLDALGEAQEAALVRTWAYAVAEFDDRDLAWFLLGTLPFATPHPRAFLAEVADRLFPAGLPAHDPHARRIDRPDDFLFDLLPPPGNRP
ncbi:hypothetical protein [Deinococcus planocerae]|uniref:hypothetical protein n=1 Tax=Deinococcus planocerae TaxID=1737569 RepID=UPI000C7EFD3D|nr:hypothetical protein [Deinococcus planocerae]